MIERVPIKVGRIVMIAPYENDPVVRIIHTLAIAPYNVLIVTFLLKSKSAVASHNEQGIFHLVLHAKLVYEKIEVTMNVPRNNYALGFGKL